MAKSTIGKKDQKEECLDTKQGKYLQQLRVHSGIEEMRKEERGHEFSDNRKEQVENMKGKVLVINIGKLYTSIERNEIRLGKTRDERKEEDLERKGSKGERSSKC